MEKIVEALPDDDGLIIRKVKAMMTDSSRDRKCKLEKAISEYS